MASDLFDDRGRPRFGLYTGQIQDLSLAGYRHPLLPGMLKGLRAKRWRFVGLFQPDVVAGVAVVDASYIGTCFAYCCDLKTRRMVEFNASSPLARSVSISDSLSKGEARYAHGDDMVQMYWSEEGRSQHVEVEVSTASGRMRLHASFDETSETAVPHQVITPTPGKRVAFTHKTAGMPAAGEIILPERTYTLSPDVCCAGVDHTVGYHDRHWQWRWAAFGGVGIDGVRLGLNLVDPILHHTFHENALWVGGRRYPTSRAVFDFDPRSTTAPWKIHTEDGMLEATFNPVNNRSDNLNVGLLKSRFRQHCGTFEGRIRLPDGAEHRFAGLPGVAEDHESLW